MLTPFGLGIYAVAGNARGILNDGAALADQLIEKRAFTNVRSAYYCYYWF
jgi:hypothetical protein